jgi:DNA-binding CsgD family transcriptional regulator
MVMPVMTAPALSLTAAQHAELTRRAAASSLPHRQVVQAKALLLAADGVANQQIARRCQVEPDTVRRWRARFTEQGVDGVAKIAQGRGRKSKQLQQDHAWSGNAGRPAGGSPYGRPWRRPDKPELFTSVVMFAF